MVRRRGSPGIPGDPDSGLSLGLLEGRPRMGLSFSRRQFLAASGAAAVTAQSASKPNFIFFMPETLRAESIGCYGHRLVRTPNLDRLAAEGTRFEQCHVQNTVCGPSRCSLMT